MNTKKRKRWIQQVWMERKPNKKNLLLTHWENATLPHKVRSWYFSNGLDMFEMYMHGSCVFNFQGDYVIQYKRINHKDFKFLLKMRNPNRVEKKVIFRLWLVPTNRTSSTARYHPATGFVNIGFVMLWENILVARKLTLLTFQDIQPQRSDCPWPLCLQADWKG